MLVSPKKKKIDKYFLSERGFTLIEILATLIIMAIISVITVPVIFKVIETSKKNAFKETVKNVIKSANIYYADNGDKLYDKFQKSGGVLSFMFDEAAGKRGETNEGDKISFDGKSPIAGELVLYYNGDIYINDVTNGRYYANKDPDTQLVITDTSGTLNREELTKALKELKEVVKGQGETIKNQGATIKELNTMVTTQGTDITNLKNKDKDLETKIADVKNNIKDIDVLNKTYPVGSIYVSTSGTSPVVLFGGSWEAYGSGRSLVGINTGDVNFNTIGKTGGSTTTTLEVGNLPSHNHSIPSLSGTTASAGGHTHTTPAVALQGGTTSNAGSHSHLMTSIGYAEGSGNVRYTVGWGYTRPDSITQMVTDSAGAHNHTVSGTVPAQTASNSGAHTHGISTNTSTTGNNGSGSAFSNLQPYITVYMWRRTA